MVLQKTFYTSMISILCLALGAQDIRPTIKQIDKVFREDPMKAIKMLDSVYQAQKNWSQANEAEIFYTYGKYYSRMEKADSTMVWAKKGYKYVQQFEIDSFIADFANILGGSYMMKSQPDSAVFYFLIAADNLKKQKDYIKSAYVYNNLANIFLDDKQFYKALEYFRAGEEILRNESNVGQFTGTLYGNMSFAYFSVDSLAQAAHYAELAIKTGLQNDDQTAQLYGILTLADLAAAKKDHATATTKYQEAYQLATDLGDDYKKALCTSSMATYFLTSSAKDAVKYGLEAEVYFKQELPRFRLPNLLTLAKAYESLGQPKDAMYYYKVYGHLTDSLAQMDYQKFKLEMLEKFETAKKSEIIAQQQSDLIANSLTNTRLFAGLVLAILGLLSLVFWNKIQKDKAAEKMKKLQEEKEQSALMAVVEGEQNERVRLAKDLHDGLANEIVALKMFTGLKNMDLNSPILHEIEHKLDLMHQNTRDTAHNMLPKSFANEGLLASLEALCKDYSTVVPVTFTNHNYIFGKRKSFELFVYRIAQEVISNAVKYANASHIDVVIDDTGSALKLTVTDDGKGIADDVLNSGFGFVRSRLYDLGGDMAVHTSPDTGTEVNINIKYGV